MKARICPRCGKKYYEYPAISRKDNKTEICSNCGTEEALEYFVTIEHDFKNGLKKGKVNKMKDNRIENLKRNLVEELKHKLSAYYDKDTFCQEDLENEDFLEWFQEETYHDNVMEDFYNETGIELMVCDYVFNENGELEVIVQEP